jgi:hypothetical protein
MERLLAGPFGPDVVGIRLGMPLDHAEAAVRQSMSVGRVLETPPPAPAQTRPPAWLHGRLFVAADGKERIAIFEGQGQAAGRVVGVWRLLPLPRTVQIEEQAKQSLKAKYGQPLRETPDTVVWNGRPSTEGHCTNGLNADWQDWVENGRSVRFGSAVDPDQPGIPVQYPDTGRKLDYDACGPALSARIAGGRVANSAGQTDVNVTVMLMDLGLMGQLAGQPGAVPPPPAPPPMKF